MEETRVKKKRNATVSNKEKRQEKKQNTQSKDHKQEHEETCGDYEIKEILDCKQVNGKKKYLVVYENEAIEPSVEWLEWNEGWNGDEVIAKFQQLFENMKGNNKRIFEGLKRHTDRLSYKNKNWNNLVQIKRWLLPGKEDISDSVTEDILNNIKDISSVWKKISLHCCAVENESGSQVPDASIRENPVGVAPIGTEVDVQDPTTEHEMSFSPRTQESQTPTMVDESSKEWHVRKPQDLMIVIDRATSSTNNREAICNTGQSEQEGTKEAESGAIIKRKRGRPRKGEPKNK